MIKNVIIFVLLFLLLSLYCNAQPSVTTEGERITVHVTIVNDMNEYP
jgi:hypothetical protein